MDYNDVTLDKVLEMAMQLPPEQQYILLDVLQRHRIEVRRREIAADARESVKLFRNRQLTTQSIDSILEELQETPGNQECGSL